VDVGPLLKTAQRYLRFCILLFCWIVVHFYGTINGEINLEAQQTCFYESFSQAILLSNFQLLTVNDLTVAIYIDTTRNLFYLFD
jgi:hypothetical protein